MEERESWHVSFVNAGITYGYWCDIRCSCKNVYYTGVFRVGGERKTVRAFKELVK